MKKSLLFLILALSFAILSLTGCNRNNSRTGGAEPTEAELQAALEAIQQMVGGVGANAPTSTTAPASTSAPAPTAAPVSGPSTWTAVEESTFDKSDIYSIAYGNNRFVAGGYDGEMAYSADGASWTAVSNSAFTNGFIRGIAYGNNRFVAVGSVSLVISPGSILSHPGKIAYSDDNGETWTAVSNTTFDASDNVIQAIAYGNNRFVAVGYKGKMAYSNDGISWTAVSDSKFPSTDSDGDSFQINAIAYGNNRFVAVGDNGKMAYSTDGANWTAVADSKFPSTESIGGNYAFQIRTIAYGTAGNAGGRFVAGGYEGKMAYSDNGTSWTAVSSANSPFREYSIIGPIAYGNNRFVAVDGSDIAYSDNGTSWTAVADSTFGWYHINAIAYGNNRFVAGGDKDQGNGEGKMAYADW